MMNYMCNGKGSKEGYKQVTRLLLIQITLFLFKQIWAGPGLYPVEKHRYQDVRRPRSDRRMVQPSITHGMTMKGSVPVSAWLRPFEIHKHSQELM